MNQPNECCRVRPMEQSKPHDGKIVKRLLCLYCGRHTDWHDTNTATLKEWNDTNADRASTVRRHTPHR